jgi:hypothetical protein
MIRGAVVLGALVVVVGLSGCAPAVTTAAHPSSSHTVAAPTPTVPSLADLVLSPDGLGPLVIGSPVPDETAGSAVVLWDSTKCGGAGAWLANYPVGPIGGDGDPTGAPFSFAVQHQTEPLSYINVVSTQIKTSMGISIGDTRTQVTTAYPHADAVVTGPLTDLYEINGAKAKLVIEVGRLGEVPAAEVNKVVLMEVNGLGSAPGSLYGNDAGGGICPSTE